MTCVTIPVFILRGAQSLLFLPGEFGAGAGGEWCLGVADPVLRPMELRCGAGRGGGCWPTHQTRGSFSLNHLLPCDLHTSAKTLSSFKEVGVMVAALWACVQRGCPFRGPASPGPFLSHWQLRFPLAARLPWLTRLPAFLESLPPASASSVIVSAPKGIPPKRLPQLGTRDSKGAGQLKDTSSDDPLGAAQSA